MPLDSMQTGLCACPFPHAPKGVAEPTVSSACVYTGTANIVSAETSASSDPSHGKTVSPPPSSLFQKPEQTHVPVLVIITTHWDSKSKVCTINDSCKKDLCIYLFIQYAWMAEWHRVKNRDRHANGQISHPLIISGCCNNQSWGRLKPGNWRSP